METTVVLSSDGNYFLKITGTWSTTVEAEDDLAKIINGDLQIDEIKSTEAPDVVGNVVASPSITIWLVYGAAFKAILRGFGIII